MGVGLFVAGTDTGVGKTAVACGILDVLRREGRRLGALKPAESGHDGPPGSWPPDAAALNAASGTSRERDAVVPYVLRDAMAPLVAAQEAGLTIDASRLDRAWTSARDAHDLTLVEAAGGLAVPLTRTLTMVDLAARWRLPVLLVARAGLGTINHSVLSVEYARNRGLHVIGVVLNQASLPATRVEETNPAQIERLSGVPVLGLVPRVAGVDIEAGRWEPMGPAVARHVDLGPVRAWMEGGIRLATT